MSVNNHALGCLNKAKKNYQVAGRDDNRLQLHDHAKGSKHRELAGVHTHIMIIIREKRLIRCE